MDLERQKQRLAQLGKELQTQLDRPDDADSSITVDNAIGRLTRMEAMQAQQIGAAGRRRIEQRLRKVNKCILAIQNGTYGSCVLCGSAIPEGRLEVMPEARLCMRCSARR